MRVRLGQTKIKKFPSKPTYFMDSGYLLYANTLQSTKNK